MSDSGKIENYYKMMGLNSSATDAEIRRAYRVLARRYHPDVNPGEASVERFKAIAEAYEVLSDSGKRRQYDISFEREQGSYHHKQFRAYRDQMQRQSASEKFFQAQKADYEQIKAWQSKVGSAAASAKAGAGKPPPRVDLKIPPSGANWKAKFEGWRRNLSSFCEGKLRRNKTAVIQKISIIEVSLAIRDVITGARKTVEI